MDVCLYTASAIGIEENHGSKSGAQKKVVRNYDPLDKEEYGIPPYKSLTENDGCNLHGRSGQMQDRCG